jgi:hypothetical protein
VPFKFEIRQPVSLYQEQEVPIYIGTNKQPSVHEILGDLYFFVKPVGNFKWMETFLVEGPNPNAKAKDPRPVHFLNATFHNFNITNGEF